MNLDDDVDDIICYVKQGQDPNSQWKIVLPASMLDETVKWFHTVIGHPGEKRLRMTLQDDIIILNCNTLLTGSSVVIAKCTSFLVMVMD